MKEKSFKQYRKEVEEMMTAADAGIPKDTANMMPKKKRKTRPLTRNYIEILGKRKKQIV